MRIYICNDCHGRIDPDDPEDVTLEDGLTRCCWSPTILESSENEEEEEEEDE